MHNHTPSRRHGDIALDPSSAIGAIGRRERFAADLPQLADASRRLRALLEAAGQAIGGAARRMLVRAKRRREVFATYCALSELDARTLRDIGFDRSELLSVAAELAGEADSTRVRTVRTVRTDRGPRG